MIDEWHLRILSKPDFSFMISDQDVGWVETCYQTADYKVQKVGTKNV